jgi:hypothetical protein
VSATGQQPSSNRPANVQQPRYHQNEVFTGFELAKRQSDNTLQSKKEIPEQ